MAVRHAVTRAGDSSWPVRRTTVFLLATVLVAGCASGGIEGGGTSSSRTTIQALNDVQKFDLSRDQLTIRTLIAAPPAAVWAAVPGVYAALGLQGSVVDSPGRVFGIPQQVAAPDRVGGQLLTRFLRCGSGITGFSVDSYQVYMMLLTQIDSVAQGSLVLTRIGAFAQERGVSGVSVDCSTNGRLEHLIADSLKVRVGVSTQPSRQE